MLLVHAKSTVVSSQEKIFSFRFALYSECSLVYCCITKMRKCWEAVPVKGCPFFTFCILFRFHIFFRNWKWEIYRVIRCIFLLLFFFTGLIIHDIHLCLQAPAWIDQSLIGGKCGSAAECRLNSIIENFKDREEQSSPSGGFPHCSQYWKSSEPSLAPWPLVSKHLFV